jgi:elongation factor Ts
VANLGQAALKTDAPLAESMKDAVVAKVVEIGENIVVTRNTRFVMTQPGLLETYIHLGGKVGVLIELGCGKAETAKSDVAREVAKDLTLHIAACAPRYLQRDEVSAEDVAAERAIYAKQVEGKPAQIVGKIVEGKMQKYFAEVCLVDQGFVKEPKQAVKDLLVEKGKQVGDTLTVRRFVRYQLGQ